MDKRSFNALLADLTRRVDGEGKKNPSWLMGYLQGLGSRTLTGYQCAALVDLLLVPLEKTAAVEQEEPAEDIGDIPEEKAEKKPFRSLIETLAQR